MNTRSFASGDFPPHMKLEMPNLSPTMEKVQFKTKLYPDVNNLSRETFPNG
jgi:hypothetical protein